MLVLSIRPGTIDEKITIMLFFPAPNSIINLINDTLIIIGSMCDTSSILIFCYMYNVMKFAKKCFQNKK